MTSDEKALCNQLDSCNLCIDGEWRDEVAEQAAALIRRQAEEIDMLARALVAVQYVFKCENLHHKKKHQHDFDEDCPVVAHYAPALAIAKEQA